MLRAIFWTVMSGALCMGSVAVADTTSKEAKAQFEQGLELFSDGQYEQAAIAFERAYDLKPSYKILFNVGQVQNELRHYAAALEAYMLYLAEGGDKIDSLRRKEVQHEVKRLNALVGMINVQTKVKGAVVFVDGRRQGETPLSGKVFVDLGEHEVLVKEDGEQIHKEIVKVAGGQSVTVEFEIKSNADTAKPVKPVEETPPPEDDEEPPKRVWTWVALGIGAAAAVGAGVTGGMSYSLVNDIKDDCDGNNCPSGREDDAGKAENLGNVSTALTVAAAVGITAGVLLFFLEPGDDKEESKASVAIVPSAAPDNVGLSLTGRF
jgi:hypothetical protein